MPSYIWLWFQNQVLDTSPSESQSVSDDSACASDADTEPPVPDWPSQVSSPVE